MVQRETVWKQWDRVMIESSTRGQGSMRGPQETDGQVNACSVVLPFKGKGD